MFVVFFSFWVLQFRSLTLPLKIGRDPKGEFILQSSIFRGGMLLSGKVCVYIYINIVRLVLIFLFWNQLVGFLMMSSDG